MRKSKTFRLELVYLDLLKAIVKKNEGKMNNDKGNLVKFI